MNIKPGDYFVVSPAAADQAEYRRKFAGMVFECLTAVGPLVAAKAICGPLDYRPLLQHVDLSRFETYPVSREYVQEILEIQGERSCHRPIPRKSSTSVLN